jgi:iron complex outermembrane receptor protein
LSAEDSAADEVLTGTDSVAPDFTNAPGPVNDAREAHAAILALGYQGFSLDLQYLDTGHGEQFGVGNALPAPGERVIFEHSNTTFEARQRLALPSDLQATLRLGWLRHEFNAEDSVATINPLFGTVFASADYEEQKSYAGLLVDGRLGDRHKLLFDLQYSETEVKQAAQSGSNPLVIPEGQFIEPAEHRRHLSLALQDQLSINDAVTLTAGLRYDDYSDVGDQLSPRLAAVWRLSDRHIFKAQYAEAFRPPTFLELYTTSNPVLAGNPHIEPTVNRNYELGYIFKAIETTVRATLFHTKLAELITVVDGQYVNAGDARLRGVELELEHAFSKALFLKGNLSYIDAKDQATNRDLPGMADWLGNLGLSYRLHPGILLAANYRYVDERARSATDPRSSLDGYQTVDLTVSLADRLQPGLTLRAGVRNLFDEAIAYPAPPATYPDDYPQRGRQWWLQAEYTF